MNSIVDRTLVGNGNGSKVWYTISTNALKMCYLG